MRPPERSRFSGRLIPASVWQGLKPDWIIPLVRKLIDEGQQLIVFRETKGEARGVCKLSRRCTRPSTRSRCARNSSPSPILRKPATTYGFALEHGVAFH